MVPLVPTAHPSMEVGDVEEVEEELLEELVEELLLLTDILTDTT